MFKLRDYQQRTVDRVLNFLKDTSTYKKVVIVEPTAAGKSLIIASIVKETDSAVIVLQPNKELLIQNYNKYLPYEEAGIFSASLNEKSLQRVTFATIGSIKKYGPEIKERFNRITIILDECHLNCGSTGMTASFLKSLGNKVKIIGLTATPIILDSGLGGSELKMLNRARKSLFSDIISVTQIRDISEKYWCTLKYKTVELDTSRLRYNTSGSEFTDVSIRAMYEENDIESLVLKHVELLRPIKKSILIFCPSIVEAKDLQTKIEGSEVITSDTPDKERDKIVTDFKEGKVQILINVFIFLVGFDMPSLSCIINTIPTASFARYYQQVGRLVRVDPDNPNKIAHYIDYSGNFKRFGRLDNVVFYNHPTEGWGMFNGDVVMTGIPVQDIGTVRLAPAITKFDANAYKNVKFPFGKFAGKLISIASKDYLRWFVQNISKTSQNRELLNAVNNYLLK